MSRILYLGLTVPDELHQQAIHCPLIKIVPRALSEPDIRLAFADFLAYTHLVLTSQTTIPLFLEAANFYQLSLDAIQTKKVVAVGQKTAAKLSQYGLKADFIPQEETAEGIRDLFADWDKDLVYPFWPHSSLSRTILKDFWTQKEIKYRECILYATVTNDEIVLPDLSSIDEIIFTSPSTVDAFLERYQSLPKDKKLTSIGPVTARRLKEAKEQIF
ncbi:uroporphyrinogen-III synthase [Parachlamydia sp. AcF125]|uniref:uroporphyrinogen-III synthase n=1 Tax=Parachlamydia sp. AcF125 TaxID=2795736 RepID=UPI001BC9C6D4|nr:uroporphyrinogen-III synthase [Parachlamydia sp. AcF125]MBS4168066.1 hypothetical protein [Parachlamydia sp. AcF125]